MSPTGLILFYTPANQSRKITEGHVSTQGRMKPLEACTELKSCLGSKWKWPSEVFFTNAIYTYSIYLKRKAHKAGRIFSIFLVERRGWKCFLNLNSLCRRRAENVFWNYFLRKCGCLGSSMSWSTLAVEQEWGNLVPITSPIIFHRRNIGYCWINGQSFQPKKDPRSHIYQRQHKVAK